jgi:hypothetical protein
VVFSEDDTEPVDKVAAIVFLAFNTKPLTFPVIADAEIESCGETDEFESEHNAACPLLSLIVKDAQKFVEYAVGTIAAAAFATILYAVVTGTPVVSALGSLVTRALSVKF